MPKVSIITVCLNDRRGLEKTLTSSFAQKCSGGVEMIVIDGGSIDGCAELLREHAERLAFWCSEPDKGIFNAMNKGVAHASGEFCIFMNAGDTFASNDVLEKIFDGNAAIVETADMVVGTAHCQRNGETVRVEVAPKRLTFAFFAGFRGYLNHQSTFTRREWLLKYPYDESLKIVGDWKFCLQALIFDDARYAAIDVPVGIFDLAGVDSRKPGREEAEREKVFRELKIARILADYDFIMNEVGNASWRRRWLRKLFRRTYNKWANNLQK